MSVHRGFRHYVRDKHGKIDMEIFSSDGIWFRLHFPRWEFLGNQMNKMRLPDISALIFAYDENEYARFSDELKKYVNLEQHNA